MLSVMTEGSSVVSYIAEAVLTRLGGGSKTKQTGRELHYEFLFVSGRHEAGLASAVIHVDSEGL